MNRQVTLTFLLLLLLPSFILAQCQKGNCIEGVGTYLYASGAKYIGEFQNGKKNGYGVCYFTDGSVYKGEWLNDFPHGKGTKILSEQHQWQGQWLRGRPVDKEGFPIDVKKLLTGNPETDAVFSKSGTLEGCISGNCIDGYGVYVFRDQTARYEGTFSGEMPHGQGAIYYQNGDVYLGDWANGSFEGQGTLTLKDGSKITGYWKNGRHVGAVNPFEQNTPTRFSGSSAPSAPVKIWAVIVGIGAYNHMPTLSFTDDDAYRIYAFLKSPQGGALPDEQIRVLIDEDATRDRVLYALKDVFMNAGSNDLVLFYFSGHGLPGSFLPIDFDGRNQQIFHEEVKNILTQSTAKYKLCIADACHSGGLLTDKGMSTENALLKYYEALAQSSPGSALILSSKSTETSLESTGLRQGVFSHFLLRGLKGEANTNQDDFVTVQELFDFTYHNVRSYTGSRQSPVIKGNFDRNMPVSVIR